MDHILMFFNFSLQEVNFMNFSYLGHFNFFLVSEQLHNSCIAVQRQYH